MNTKTRDTIIYVIAGVVCLGMMVLFAIVGRSVYLDKTKDSRLLDNDTKTTATSTEEKDKVTEIKYVVDDTPLKEYVPEIERETEFADYVSDHDNETVVVVTLKQQKTTSYSGSTYINGVNPRNGLTKEQEDALIRLLQGERSAGSIPHGTKHLDGYLSDGRKAMPVELR